MRKQIADPIKSERLARLQALLAEQTRAFNDRSVGRVLPVLLERPGRHPGQQVGRTPYLQAVHVDSPGSALGETDRCPDHRESRPQPGRGRGRAGGGAARCPLPRNASMRLKPLSLEPEGVVSRTLSFEDNARCAVLFGRHHEHLALVEQHLPVTLAARGNLVTISGEPEAADAAAAVLEELYRQLDGGLDLGRSEVDAAIRMIVRGPRDAAGVDRRRRRHPHRAAAGEPALAHPGGLPARDAPARSGVRDRSGRHRQDLSRGRHRRRAAQATRGRPVDPVAPGGRGRRAARVSSRAT